MADSLYYLSYKPPKRKDSRDALLSIRAPTKKSKDYVIIGGRRAYLIFNEIIRVLNAYSLKYNKSKWRKRILIELSGDIGVSILTHLLFVYGTRKPDKYTSFLEKLLSGKLPLINYILALTNLGIELTELKKLNMRKSLISDKAARVVSSIMRIINKYLEKA
ncbi:MAG: hypothetical protein ACTSVW_04000 [Candidatus Njordarchaeales archaeon]